MVAGMAKDLRPAPFPIRLSPDLRKRLEALASADRRSLTNYILLVLERHAEAAERSSDGDQRGTSRKN